MQVFANLSSGITLKIRSTLNFYHVYLLRAIAVAVNVRLHRIFLHSSQFREVEHTENCDRQ